MTYHLAQFKLSSAQRFSLFWYTLSLLIIVSFGLSHLYYPLGPDQATILYGARELSQGALLYVDYWDNKQPGLYYFYYFAGQLFGFSEFGIHLFELIWLIMFSVVLVVTLGGYLRHTWLAAIAPVAVVAVYYAVVGEDELTQLEMIVGLPLYLSMWFTYKAQLNPQKLVLCLSISGFFAGIAVLFKLVLACLPMLFWIIGAFYLCNTLHNGRVHMILKSILAIGAGAAVPLILTLSYFWSQNGLSQLLWTAFIYPGQALLHSPSAGLSRLITSAGFYLSYYGPWFIFMVIAIYRWASNCRNLLTTMLIGWLGMAVVLFVIQRFSWWHYHTLLFFVPTGILAVLGIEQIITYVQQHLRGNPVKVANITGLIILLPLLAALAPAFVYKSQTLLRQIAFNNGVQLYQWEISPRYRALWQSATLLRNKNAKPGPIYVFGNAMMYAFTERQCADKTTGSAWEFYLPEQIDHLLNNLAEKQVPYIFVGKDDYKIYSMNIAVKIFINTRYSAVQKDAGGTWYQLKEGVSG